MIKPLPTIYHGIPEPGEDSDTVETALQELVARFNQVPFHLSPRVICGLVTSVCCAQPDPAAAFGIIGVNVGRAIAMALMENKGSA